jgi:hypothetical protein
MNHPAASYGECARCRIQDAQTMCVMKRPPIRLRKARDEVRLKRNFLKKDFHAVGNVKNG